MIWNVIADTSALRVRTNFDSVVYLQEQPTIEVLSKTGIEVVLVAGADIIYYKPNEDNIVNINMTDYFSAVRNGSVFVATPVTERIEIYFAVVGMVSPESMIIPRISELQDYVPVLPPRKYIELPFGIYGSFSVWRNSQSANIVAGGYGVESLPLAVLNTNVRISEYNTIKNIDTEEEYKAVRSSMICNRTYAAVRWITRWGGENVLAFEVRDIKTTSIDSVNLATRFNDYSVRKGYEESFILHIDGLNRYDYWYYCDILTSNDVRVAVNEADADFGDDTRVQILTDGLTQKNADGFYSLDIEVRYKKYDRV